MDMFTPMTEAAYNDLSGIESFGLKFECVTLPFLGWGIIVKNVPEGDIRELMYSMGYTQFN